MPQPESHARFHDQCLLPGLLCDATVWAAERAALIGASDAYIPDFMGMDSFEAMALKVLDETRGGLSVAGHSMGGRVAFEIWRLAPERLVRLALLDTGFHGPHPGEAPRRMALVRVAYEEGMDAVADLWLPPMVHPARLDDQALMAPLRAMVRRATPQAFEGQQRAGLNRPDATSYLPRIACPTLVVCGRQDGWSPVAQHEVMARTIPGAALSLIEHCGHMAMVERPDEVTGALQAWLHGMRRSRRP